MSIQQAYNSWASQYDSNDNKTRDLEAVALRQILGGQQYRQALEIGCGTGKNSSWLKTVCSSLVSIDFSEEMLSKAREKVKDSHVQFHRADILQPWTFTEGKTFDLVVCSLVLEHIEDLKPVFEKMAAVLHPGGVVYIGELHPFKQYAGSKARFGEGESLTVVDCYTHHVSDFTGAANANGLQLIYLKEFFDDGREGLPRILALKFRK